ncbi:hypothetical protein V2I01_31790 [Micromonospora sp. BRA006-A]|nr:hypothetical protein [Micromonospora sp. BRA006-A]
MRHPGGVPRRRRGPGRRPGAAGRAGGRRRPGRAGSRRRPARLAPGRRRRLLLVAGAVRSAQVPAHRWLPYTLDAPTPGLPPSCTRAWSTSPAS